MPEFEKQTGHKVTVINDTAGALNQRIRTGEPFDIVIAAADDLEPLAAEGKVIDEFDDAVRQGRRSASPWR